MIKKNNSFKITLCGIITAMSVVCMFCAGFMPLLSYTLPALAGGFIVVVVIEINKKWAVLTYIAVSFMSFFLVSDKEAVTLFILFLGYYPILKSTFEKTRSRILEYFLKIICFNIAIIICYFILINLLGMNELIDELNTFGKYSVLFFVIAANVAFILYDYALTGVISVYVNKFREKISRRLK